MRATFWAFPLHASDPGALHGQPSTPTAPVPVGAHASGPDSAPESVAPESIPPLAPESVAPESAVAASIPPLDPESIGAESDPSPPPVSVTSSPDAASGALESFPGTVASASPVVES